MREDRVVRPITPDQASPKLAQTLAHAFQDDPALSWIVPDSDARRRMLPGFFAIMVEQSFRHGEVLASEDFGAVSLWYPPGVVKDGPITALWDSLRQVRLFKTALPRGLKVSEAMYARHPSPQPHSYLRYVGVAPEAQGKGWGGALVRAGVARAAEKGLGVLLETATPSNVAIYSRLGFEISDEWAVPSGGPQFWTMIRTPS